MRSRLAERDPRRCERRGGEAIKKKEDTHEMAEANNAPSRTTAGNQAYRTASTCRQSGAARPIQDGPRRRLARAGRVASVLLTARQVHHSRASATSASWPTSMPGRRLRPSASSTTPARPTRSARCTKAPPRWTGWSRSRSAASRSRPPRRPAFWTRNGIEYRINIIDTPGPRRLHRRGRALAARARRRRRRCSTRSPASSRRPRRCGARPTATACRASSSSNKMDRVGADFDRCLTMIRDRLTQERVSAPAAGRLGRAVHRPHRRHRAQAVHLRRRDARQDVRRGRRAGGAIKDAVEQARHDADRGARSSTTTTLMEKYLGGDELTSSEIRRAIRKATVARQIVPVLCGASFKNKGVQALLDAVIDYLPAPVDVPPIKGHLPHHDEHVRRAPRRRTTRRSRRWRSRSRPIRSSGS
mgnify:CR=1 FL=1